MDQRVPPPVPSDDEYDAAYDQEISYGDVQPVEDIRTMGLMEQIDPFKRATFKEPKNSGVKGSMDTLFHSLL